MDRRDLLKLIAITPIASALKAGKVTEVPPIKPGEVDVTATLLNETEVFQFREGEIKIFEVPDCTSMTIYAEEENSGPIYFGAEKDPAVDGLQLRPGRQFIAGDVPAAHLYAVGPTDALMIVTFTSGHKS